MNAASSYNEVVRRHFTDPQHAGDLQRPYETMLNADVADSDNGIHIVIKAGIRAGTIGEMAFRVWGCPHLIAALEIVCERLVGQPVASLENYDLADITQELCLPAEKMSRILLLEDALATLWAEGCSAAN